MKLKTILTGGGAPRCALRLGRPGRTRCRTASSTSSTGRRSSIMNPYLSSGTKDIEAASLVLEPLARFDEKGNMVPYLAAEIPDARERRHCEDLKIDHLEAQAGRRLVRRHAGHRRGRGLHLAVLHRIPRAAAPSCRTTATSTNVEAVDPQTIKVTFDVAEALSLRPVRRRAVADPAEGAVRGLPRRQGAALHRGEHQADRHRAVRGHRLQGQRRGDARGQPELPRPGRSPPSPASCLKGGGDAASAARAVLETGEFDYAWNAQVEPEILAQMAGGRARAR